MSRRGAAGVAASVLVAVLALGGCGVPKRGSATKVDDDDVPYRLLDESSGADTDVPPAGQSNGVIYLARDGKLLATTRRLPPPLTLPRLLRALGRGPTRPESAAGIRTALPVEDTPKRVRVQGGTAIVDLPQSFLALSQSDQVLALAQIVYTVTNTPGIGQVEFTLDGAATEIPRADRSLTSLPVSRDDYASLAPG